MGSSLTNDVFLALGSIIATAVAPLFHWRFMPSEVEYREEMTKRKKKNGPT